MVELCHKDCFCPLCRRFHISSDVIRYEYLCRKTTNGKTGLYMIDDALEQERHKDPLLCQTGLVVFPSLLKCPLAITKDSS